MPNQPNPFLQQLQKQYPQHFARKKVLAAGSDTRCYFSHCSYAMHHGALATPLHRLDMPKAFEVIVHAGTLHYDPHWINTVCAMYRNLQSGGALIITCAGPDTGLYEEEEAQPHCHALTVEELSALLPATAFTTYQIGYAPLTHALEFFGVKK